MEEVVLLDGRGHAVGVADKARVHHQDTPLHLAFSCYVFNAREEVLITRRAWTKRTWPGVWTNTCCGHPGPGEPLTGSVHRRLWTELGIVPAAVDLVLPRFRYRALMASGVAENEMCPVFRAYTNTAPEPNPTEVAATQWVSWSRFATGVQDRSIPVSPWCDEQVRQLCELGPNPGRWQTAPAEELPPAARLSLAH